jgi:hypothetical protein
MLRKLVNEIAARGRRGRRVRILLQLWPLEESG